MAISKIRKRTLIAESELPLIRERLAKGESFTSVGESYGVKAWTIQKRLKCFHPTGGRNFGGWWEVIDERRFYAAVRSVARRYSYVDVNMQDVVMDYGLRMTRHELEIVKASRCSYLKLCDILKAKVWMCYIKKRSRIRERNVFDTAAEALVYNSRPQMYEDNLMEQVESN